jgi:hypothetical protein
LNPAVAKCRIAMRNNIVGLGSSGSCKEGEETLRINVAAIAPAVSDDEARTRYGDFTKVKPYLSATTQPKD